jgi:hypothetical protein
MPGNLRSTRNAEMPLVRCSPVRANTTNRSAFSPVVIHSLAPSRTHRSPFFFAVQRSAAASDPAPASDRQ